MRILIVNEITMYMLGGVSTETAQLIRGLGARGHQVAFLGDLIREGTGPVRHLPLKLPIDRSLTEPFQKAIDAFKPDLIHVTYLGDRGIVQTASQLRSIPSVFTCHSLPPYERVFQHFHRNETAYYAARSLRYAPKAILWNLFFRSGFISHAIVHNHFVENIVKRYGQPKKRISLIPLGCEVAENVKPLPRPARSSQQLRLVTIGGFWHTKGYHDALMALADLRSEFSDLEYTLIGEVRDQSYVRYLEAMIKRLGLGNSVRFLVNATDAEKEEALRRADIYLQPSHEEGFALLIWKLRRLCLC